MEKDLSYAIHQFLEKRNTLHGLTEIYHDQVKTWREMDRMPKVHQRDKVSSVYCHKPLANCEYFKIA